LGLLGVKGLLSDLTVLKAFDPRYGILFLFDHPGLSAAVLGAVVLTVTGGEALYADMGHFGASPINRTWLLIVLPSLLLNYLGQGALLLDDPTAITHPFYRLAPDWALFPMVGLAALATIIASQAVISGAFSIANQAVQLGYIPRLRVRHTSADEIGQVYVSKVNLMLFVGVVSLVLGFQNSESLASAYGISVTGAMAVDTVLVAYFMIAVRGWNKWLFIPLFALFFLIDLIFLGANLFKFFEGGWLPIAVACVALIVMVSWIRGRESLLAARWRDAISLRDFLSSIREGHPQRVEGTAIFMVPHSDVVPIALLHNL
jgi:KUP system potassium uptake protein